MYFELGQVRQVNTDEKRSPVALVFEELPDKRSKMVVPADVNSTLILFLYIYQDEGDRREMYDRTVCRNRTFVTFPVLTELSNLTYLHNFLLKYLSVSVVLHLKS